MIVTCCAPGCDSPVEGAHILCIHHWRSLDAKTRREICKRTYGWKAKDLSRQLAVDAILRIRKLAARA
jgi:hypothetical protein